MTYFSRYRWYPWRQKIIKSRNAQTLKSKQLIPYQPFNSNKDAVFSFTKTEIPLSLRKLQTYARILRHRHLQDGIDWLNALTRPSSKPILHLLLRIRQTLVGEGHDLARIFIKIAEKMTGKYNKRVFTRRDGGYTIRRNNSHKFRVTVRIASLEELFQKTYIEGKVPRCIVMDMQNAVREGHVSPTAAQSFLPYLNAASRREHRKRLKWSFLTKKFDYNEERKKWIANYQKNLQNHENAYRQARGLLPKLDIF